MTSNSIKLLMLMDKEFGADFGEIVSSGFRKVGESFDQNSNEHVILIEYRVERKGDLLIRKDMSREQKMLRDINMLANLRKNRAENGS